MPKRRVKPDSPPFPEGFYVMEADGGFDRPREACETVEDVLARFRENPRPLLRCAYCNEELQTRDKAIGIAWFRSHECAGEGEVLAV